MIARKSIQIRHDGVRRTRPEMRAENGIEADGTLILRRAQNADGRTRAFVNDVNVSVQLLRQVGQALVEIHGQHDDRALIDQSGHRDLLDAFGSLTDQAQSVAAAWEAWRSAEDTRAQAASDLASVRANADYLAHALEELRATNPQSGEEESLAARRQLMMNAEKIAGDEPVCHVSYYEAEAYARWAELEEKSNAGGD